MPPSDSRDPPVPPPVPRNDPQWTNRDVRMKLPTDFDEDPPLSLAPIDPETEAARQRIRSAEQGPVRPVFEDTTKRTRWQFTLGQLILANTVLAVVLALCQVFAPSLLAGALGLVAFSAFAFVTVYQPEWREAYPVAWAMIVVYLLVAIVALLRG